MIVISMVFSWLITSWVICHNYRNLHLTFKQKSATTRVTWRFRAMKLFNVLSLGEIINKWLHLCITTKITSLANARYTHFHMISNIFLISTIPFPVVSSGKFMFWRWMTITLSKIHCFGSSLTTCLFSNTWKYPMRNHRKTSSVHLRCSFSLTSNISTWNMHMMIMPNYFFWRGIPVYLVCRRSTLDTIPSEDSQTTSTAIRQISISME